MWVKGLRGLSVLHVNTCSLQRPTVVASNVLLICSFVGNCHICQREIYPCSSWLEMCSKTL